MTQGHGTWPNGADADADAAPPLSLQDAKHLVRNTAHALELTVNRRAPGGGGSGGFGGGGGGGGVGLPGWLPGGVAEALEVAGRGVGEVAEAAKAKIDELLETDQAKEIRERCAVARAHTHTHTHESPGSSFAQHLPSRHLHSATAILPLHPSTPN